jgi:hypothetical protein
LEEMSDDPNTAEEYFYEELDLSGGVKGVDCVIAYGADHGEGDPE